MTIRYTQDMRECTTGFWVQYEECRELLVAVNSALECLRRLPDFDDACRVACIQQLESIIEEHRK